MTTNVYKKQFAAGELDPALHGRVDSKIYEGGADTIRNAFIVNQGGVKNRAGTVFIGQCKSSIEDVPDSRTVRILPFQFSTNDAYVLEFGHKYMRVIRNEGYVLKTLPDGTAVENLITNITQSTQATVTTKTAHGYPDGAWVYFTGIGGMSETNERILIVDTHTANTFTLLDLDGNPFDTTDFSAYTVPSSGASNGRVYEIFTKTMPYEGQHLRELTYVQSADVMTLTHESYPPYLLTRQGHAVWRLDEISFQPSIGKPSSISIDSTHADKVNIDNISRANPAVITLNSDATGIWAKGSAVRIKNVGGMTEVNGNAYVLGDIVATSPNKKFELMNTALEGINSTGYGSYTSGGHLLGTTLYRYAISAVNANGQEGRPSSAPVILSRAMSAPIVSTDTPPKILLRWNAVSGAESYNVYRQIERQGSLPSIGDIYGYIGNTTSLQFIDQNTLPDFTVTPPKFYNPFAEATQTANISGISKASPATVTTDAVHPFIVGDRMRINNVLGMTEINDALVEVGSVPSTTTVTLISPSDGTNIDTSGYSTYTSGGTLTTENPKNAPSCSAYYQQRRVFGGSILNPQTLYFSQSGDYGNMDRSNPIRASDSIEITLASLQINKIRFIVPIASLIILTGGGCFKVTGEAGTITPTTIQSTQQTYSGCGKVQPLILNNDILYTSSQSTNILALTYNFYEESYLTQDLSIRSRHLVDSYTILDWAYSKDPYNLIHMIRNDGMLLMMTYLKEAEVVAWSRGDTGGEGATDTFESVCCVTEGNENVIYYVVNRYIEAPNGGSFRQYVERLANRNIVINGVTDNKRGHFLDSGRFHDGEPINEVTNLHHLEGRTVGVVADGQSLDQRVVSGGKITLDGKYASVVSVGLPFKTQLKTLPLDTGDGSIAGKRKSIRATSLRVVNSRGIKVGTDETDLVAYPEHNFGEDWTNIPLRNGDLRYNLYSNQNSEGQILIQQDEPLPMEIAGISMEVTLGDIP